MSVSTEEDFKSNKVANYSLPAHVDWTKVFADLDAEGHAMIKNLLTPDHCKMVSSWYEEEIFRNRVVMSRHGYGRGE